MEIELTNHQEVAEPDHVSCPARFGQKNSNENGNVEYHRERNPGAKNRIVIGLGILYNGGTSPVGQGTASVPVQDDPEQEGVGDLIFASYERQERIADRLNKKIDRLDKRLTRLEKKKPAKIDAVKSRGEAGRDE